MTATTIQLKVATAKKLRREALRLGMTHDALIGSALRGWELLTSAQRAQSLRIGGAFEAGETPTKTQTAKKASIVRATS